MSICTMTLETVKSTQDVDIWMEIPIQPQGLVTTV